MTEEGAAATTAKASTNGEEENKAMSVKSTDFVPSAGAVGSKITVTNIED